MALDGVVALILRYFTEFLYDVVVKKFTFAISSPDEFSSDIIYVCQKPYGSLVFLGTVFYL